MKQKRDLLPPEQQAQFDKLVTSEDKKEFLMELGFELLDSEIPSEYFD